jgi:signal recognition particle subunit SRP54
MASLDTRRPAAQEQLRVLGEQTGSRHAADRRRPVARSRSPSARVEAAKLGGHDVVMLDTAGRTTHRRAADGRDGRDQASAPSRTKMLLVADALTGQDAVNTRASFDERVGMTGIVLTRMDGDGRGGAALAMRAVTGKPIKLIGTGEKVDALEEFHPAAHRRPHPGHGRHRLAG